MCVLEILLAALLLSSPASAPSKPGVERSGHIEVNARVGNQRLGNR